MSCSLSGKSPESVEMPESVETLSEVWTGEVWCLVSSGSDLFLKKNGYFISEVQNAR